MRSFTRFIGANCRYGQRKKGVELGATTLIKYIERDLDIEYINNFEEEGYLELFKLHNKYLNYGYKPLTIGGDHSISLSTVASSVYEYKDDLTVVWVDAHADIHTWGSSCTKNLHGMPLGCLLGHDNIYNLPEIYPEQIIYIGLRDLDPYETAIIDELNIEKYDMEYLKDNSLDDVLKNIYNKSEAIHLSFDVDVLDPKYVSCTGTPVEGGLTFDEGKKIINKLLPKIVSTDIVEFNPKLGNSDEVYRDAILINKLIDLLD